MAWSKIAGIAAAIIGMIIVNGVGLGGSNPRLGLICGVISALLYAALMLLNKFIKNLSGLESTLAHMVFRERLGNIFAYSSRNFTYGNWMLFILFFYAGTFRADHCRVELY